jgi:telomerase reverse transcriptase
MMAGKRKRSRPNHRLAGNQKHQQISDPSNSKGSVVKEALLAQFYPQVLSLREFLISKLPPSSKVRRKKILSVGKRPDSEVDQKLCKHLDQTLVGVSKHKGVSQEERWQQWTTFSQKADDSISFANLTGVGIFSQSEVGTFIHVLIAIVMECYCGETSANIVQIVDFVIWLLFSKDRASNGWVKHLLCQGFQKDISARSMHRGDNAASAIPGVLSIHPNSHVTSIKVDPWPQVLALMGKEGERAMIDLLLDCGIFLVIGSGRGSYHQLSGKCYALKAFQ